MKLGGKNDDEKLENLLAAISKLKDDIEIPHSIKEWGVPEDEFYAKLDDIVEKAFDDQCTGRQPGLSADGGYPPDLYCCL